VKVQTSTGAVLLKRTAPVGSLLHQRRQKIQQISAVKRALLHRLLLPIHMANADKDRMLQIARTVQSPQRRLAAWMTFDLPEGLIGALAEMECVE